MSKMFLGCNSLNGLLNFNDWNTESVQNFSQMFMNAGSFNQDISNWDTKNATDMSNMFRNATSFNQNINDWITDNVVNMASMFSEASSFNQSIGNWMLNPDVNMTGMLDNSGMDCEVYSRVLKDWSSNPVTPNDRILGANAMEYGTYAETGRKKLLETKGWKISGDIALSETCFSCKTQNITRHITVCDSSDLSITTDTLTTVEGCDSIITTIPTLLPTYYIEVNKASCNPADIGVLTQLLTTKNGCDSTVKIITTLLPSSELTINETTCDASEVGSSVALLTNVNGCDSVVTTITVLLPSSEVTINSTTCDANEAGTAVALFTNINGCDSVVTIISTLLPSSETIINKTTCDPLKEGVDFEVKISLKGCDSIVMIITDLLPSYEITLNESTCDSSLVGTTVNVYSTIFGCDSIVTTNTILLPKYNIIIDKVTTSLLDTGKVFKNLTSTKGCDSIVTIISSYLESERLYANVEYWTNFDSNIDRYWSLISDGISIVEPRLKTRGYNKGKVNIVVSTAENESARTKGQFSIGHADLHIDLKSVLPFIDIKMEYEWNTFDKWNSNSSNDTSGIYYIDQKSGLVLFVTEYEISNQDGKGSINLSEWARSNNVILSEKAIIRFLYQTDAVFTPNNFNSGGLHIESVHIYQNIDQTNSTEYQQTDNFENIFNIQPKARKNNPNSMDESLLSESNFDVLVYPNPVKLGERLNIELPMEIGKETSIELIDILGRRIEHVLVGTSDLFGQTISINTDKANVTGTYFVKIVSENQEVIKKIQIVRN